MKSIFFATALSLFGLTAYAQDINGAGATFPAPLYAKWAEQAKAQIGVSLNYQAIGSGGGQNQIIARTVDFGASDAPMDDTKLDLNSLLQFPTTIGAVVVIVNIPSVESNQLNLTGNILADIYAGKIKKWNDPQIVALNLKLTLPNLAIAAIYRADGSGTTFVYTSYLSAIDADWKSKTGVGTSVAWQTGSGAKGNDGVAATVRNVKGSIGYVEYVYAKNAHLVTVKMKNKDGNFVAPTVDGFKSAATHGDWKNAKHFAVNLIDQSGAESWPIVSTTFIELPTNPKDAERNNNVIKFFEWALKSGDQIASDLDYVNLPEDVKNQVRVALRHMIITR